MHYSNITKQTWKDKYTNKEHLTPKKLKSHKLNGLQQL